MAKSSILDSVIDIPAFTIIRKERIKRTHGGVYVYIKKQMKCCILPELQSSQFEVLWVKLQPTTPVDYPQLSYVQYIILQGLIIRL